MAGRFQVAWPWRRIAERFGIKHGEKVPEPWLTCIPRYNVGPTYLVPVVLEGGDDGASHADGGDGAARRLHAMRWGFPAMWLRGRGKDPWSRQLVNARSEDAHTKGTWKKALATRRCIVPATGFYEWKQVKAGGKKQRYPLLFRRPDEDLLGIAAIWGVFKRDGEPKHRFAILTAGPGPEVAPYHDRGPAFLDEADWDRWLDPALTDLDAVRSMLHDVPAGLLTPTPVSTRLGSIKNTGADLMEADWRFDEDGGVEPVSAP